jgi:hypothetical protein
MGRTNASVCPPITTNSISFKHPNPVTGHDRILSAGTFTNICAPLALPVKVPAILVADVNDDNGRSWTLCVDADAKSDAPVRVNPLSRAACIACANQSPVVLLST